jgi:ATP-dependent Clp protease ATP-binding subunit ClpX
MLVTADADAANICDRCVSNIGDVLSKTMAVDRAAQEKPLKKPREIVAYISESVISQDDAKQEVAIAVYEHYRRREIYQGGGSFTIDGETVEIEKSNILMLGPSGSGKTAIARTVAKMLDVPFYVGDATRLTQAGYVGDDVESLLQGLMADAGNDVERAQWGIIFIDEIDKLARKSGRNASGYRDVSGEGVQQSLLKLVEGSVVPIPRGRSLSSSGGSREKDMIDTTNILFICAGSFAGIEDVIAKRLNKGASLGFGNELRAKYSKTDLYRETTVEDIQEFGLIPELVGRLPVLTSTYELTEEELIEILTAPKSSFCKQFRALYSLDGIDLRFEPEALCEIAKQARLQSTGARALRSILKRVLKSYSYEAPNDSDITAIQITAEAVRKPGCGVVVRKSSMTA